MIWHFKYCLQGYHRLNLLFYDVTRFQFRSYLAPEELESHMHTLESALWSLGVLLYRILYNALPYQLPDPPTKENCLTFFSQMPLKLAQPANKKDGPKSATIQIIIRRLLTRVCEQLYRLYTSLSISLSLLIIVPPYLYIFLCLSH